MNDDANVTVARRWLPMILSITLLAAGGRAAEPAQQATLDLLLGDVSLNKLPFVLAFDEGIYERHGLDVRPMFSAGSVDIIRASGVAVPDEYIFDDVTQPAIKIGGASPTMVRLTTRAGSWDPVALGSTHSRSRWRIVGRGDIDSVADLKGKRIGYSGVGAVTHYMAVSVAQHHGWDPYFDWSMLGGALGVKSLRAGHVDAIIAPELHATMAVDAGYRVIADLGDYDLPAAGSSFLFDREWLANNEDTAMRFMKSAVDAIALLKNDRQAAYRTLRKWYQVRDEALLEHFYAEVEKLPSKPYPPIEGIRKAMSIYDSHEMRRYTPDHFYDDRFVRELDESGYIDALYR